MVVVPDESGRLLDGFGVRCGLKVESVDRDATEPLRNTLRDGWRGFTLVPLAGAGT